jgi:hypothetical protein
VPLEGSAVARIHDAPPAATLLRSRVRAIQGFLTPPRGSRRGITTPEEEAATLPPNRALPVDDHAGHNCDGDAPCTHRLGFSSSPPPLPGAAARALPSRRHLPQRPPGRNR